MRKIEVPVCAVNQILIEPLCKSVDECAKMPGVYSVLNAPKSFWSSAKRAML
jgi:hypothetical protein